jgi:hypothetical protein
MVCHGWKAEDQLPSLWKEGNRYKKGDMESE